jgi:hypothetical protein
MISDNYDAKAVGSKVITKSSFFNGQKKFLQIVTLTNGKSGLAVHGSVTKKTSLFTRRCLFKKYCLKKVYIKIKTSSKNKTATVELGYYELN